MSHDEDGKKQIAGMDPAAFWALLALTIFLIYLGATSGGDEPTPNPTPSVSTR